MCPWQSSHTNAEACTRTYRLVAQCGHCSRVLLPMSSPVGRSTFAFARRTPIATPDAITTRSRNSPMTAPAAAMNTVQSGSSGMGPASRPRPTLDADQRLLRLSTVAGLSAAVAPTVADVPPIGAAVNAAARPVEPLGATALDADPLAAVPGVRAVESLVVSALLLAVEPAVPATAVLAL